MDPEDIKISKLVPWPPPETKSRGGSEIEWTLYSAQVALSGTLKKKLDKSDLKAHADLLGDLERESARTRPWYKYYDPEGEDLYKTSAGCTAGDTSSKEQDGNSGNSTAADGATN
ncbi:uncharacterized protein L199_004106 [Kwoniella botswanensis]|uniref:uncharacterized protein n=1 Tax=Kwoniella botswanensis TaxID=1268659 RepID=UPI00315DC142